MAQTAHYFVTSVLKDKNNNISNLLIHLVSENDHFGSGSLKSQTEVINLINQNWVFYTITWGYPNWNLGAKIEVINDKDGQYLRTNRDKTAKDNLDNLINYSTF